MEHFFEGNGKYYGRECLIIVVVVDDDDVVVVTFNEMDCRFKEIIKQLKFNE